MQRVGVGARGTVVTAEPIELIERPADIVFAASVPKSGAMPASAASVINPYYASATGSQGRDRRSERTEGTIIKNKTSDRTKGVVYGKDGSLDTMKATAFLHRLANAVWIRDYCLSDSDHTPRRFGSRHHASTVKQTDPGKRTRNVRAPCQYSNH